MITFVVKEQNCRCLGKEKAFRVLPKIMSNNFMQQYRSKSDGRPTIAPSNHSLPECHKTFSLPPLSVSSLVVVDQCTWPQVHARLHSLVTPPQVHRSSFQSASQCDTRSLVEDGHVLLCHELAGVSEHVTKKAQLSIMYCVYELVPKDCEDSGITHFV